MKPLLSTSTGPSEVVATPTAPDTDVVALVPAPGVTDPALPAELVLLVPLHAAASISVAAAPSRRNVNIDADMMTFPSGLPGRDLPATIWENGFRAALVHLQTVYPSGRPEVQWQASS